MFIFQTVGVQVGCGGVVGIVARHGVKALIVCPAIERAKDKVRQRKGGIQVRVWVRRVEVINDHLSTDGLQPLPRLSRYQRTSPLQKRTRCPISKKCWYSLAKSYPIMWIWTETGLGGEQITIDSAGKGFKIEEIRKRKVAGHV
jgi:hypothetical protein